MIWREFSYHKYDYSNDMFRIRELEFEDNFDEKFDIDIDEIDRWLEWLEEE